MRGPVYSIYVGQEELLEDKRGVLEVSKDQIGNIGKIMGDKFEMNVKYKVIPNQCDMDTMDT